MKRKGRAAVAVLGAAVLAVSVAACGSSGGNKGGNAGSQPKSITVWLTVDAQNNWPTLVTQADNAFKKAHPGVTVKHEYYSWTDKNPKLDAVLATNNVPDVVEMGNTEMLPYMIKGAFAPVDVSKFDNSSTWLDGLKGSVTYNGATYGVPYYAAARIATWRKDVVSAAGVTSTPTSWSALTADLGKIQAKNGSKFSAWYQPTRDWYTAMSFVYDAGGAIATKSGSTFTASLTSPAAIKGLTAWQSVVSKYMHGDLTKDESDRYIVYGQGKAAMMYGASWEATAAAAPNVDKTGGKLKNNLVNFVLPGPSGSQMPVFLGGSDLAIPVKSKAQDLAAEWINDFTGTSAQQVLISKGNLPNNTTQLATLKSNPATAVTATAAEKSWFVPTAPGWETVEKQQILQNMLQDIATGKKSVQQAAGDADNQINQVINNS